MDLFVLNYSDLFNLFLAALAAFFVKITDIQIDDHKKIFFDSFKYFSAFAYGLLFGYLIYVDARIGAIILGIILANVFSGKFDHFAHKISLIPLFMIPFTLGLSKINFVVSALFFASALFDEKMHDSFSGKDRLFRFLSEYRLFSWIMAILVSFFSNDYIYIIALVIFDIAYKLTEYIFLKNSIT